MKHGGKWTIGVPSELTSLANVCAVAFGNDAMIERTRLFIFKMKDNQFVKPQGHMLEKSVLSKPYLLDTITECVRLVVKVMMKKMGARAAKSRATAFFSQAVLVDIFEFFECYGPHPCETPTVFEHPLLQTNRNDDFLYSDLLEMVLQTYPDYVRSILPVNWETSCLKPRYGKFHDDGIFFSGYQNNDWKTGLGYLPYFTLKPRRPMFQNDSIHPLTLCDLAAIDEPNQEKLYINALPSKSGMFPSLLIDSLHVQFQSSI